MGVKFHFHSNFKRTFCKQAVKALIRRHIMWRLICVCAVSLCHTKRTLGLYGLIKMYSILIHESVTLDPDRTQHLDRARSESKLFAKVFIIYMTILQHKYALLKIKLLKCIADVRIYSCFMQEKARKNERQKRDKNIQTVKLCNTSKL